MAFAKIIEKNIFTQYDKYILAPALPVMININVKMYHLPPLQK